VVGSGKEFCWFQCLEHPSFVYRPRFDPRASRSSYFVIAYWVHCNQNAHLYLETSLEFNLVLPMGE
jgi:hypothetical protein